MIWNEFLDILNNNKVVIPKFPIWTDWWDSASVDTNIYKLSADENDKIHIDNAMAFLKKYNNWIKKNREFYMTNKEILNDWLVNSRKNKYWIGSVRKFEWQVVFNKKSNVDSNIFTLRSSGVRVKDINYTPTLVAISHIPIIGSKNRYLTLRECLRLQSFPDNFIIYDDKIIYKQLGNAVNCYVIKKIAEFLILGRDLF